MEMWKLTMAAAVAALMATSPALAQQTTTDAPKAVSKEKVEELKAMEGAARERQSNSNYTFIEPSQDIF